MSKSFLLGIHLLWFLKVSKTSRMFSPLFNSAMNSQIVSNNQFNNVVVFSDLIKHYLGVQTKHAKFYRILLKAVISSLTVPITTESIVCFSPALKERKWFYLTKKDWLKKNIIILSFLRMLTRNTRTLLLIMTITTSLTLKRDFYPHILINPLFWCVIPTLSFTNRW